MKLLNGKFLSVCFLTAFAWFEIIYNGVSILYVIVLKLYMSPKVYNELQRLRKTITKLNVNLGGLEVNLSVENIDFSTVEDILYGVLWYIFIIDLVGLFTNLTLAACLLVGVRRGNIRMLTYWVFYGLLTLGLGVSLYPLKTAVCTAVEPKYVHLYLGSICRSILGNYIWAYAILKICLFLTVLVAWIHRRRVIKINTLNANSQPPQNEFITRLEPYLSVN